MAMTSLLEGDARPGEQATREPAAELFRGLGDPSRLAILRHLAAGEQRVVDLTVHLGLAQSTVSKHLACLRGCGLVTSRPVGRATVVTLAQPEEVLALLAAGERLLRLTGPALTPCPVSGAGLSEDA